MTNTNNIRRRSVFDFILLFLFAGSLFYYIYHTWYIPYLYKNTTTTLFHPHIDSNNIGNYKIGEKLTFSSYIKNTGRRVLIIKDFKADCSCTEYEILKKVINPNDSAAYNLVISPKFTGKNAVTLSFLANTKPEKNLIKLNYNIHK